MKFSNWSKENTAQIRIDKKFKEALQELAKREDRTMYYLTNKIIEEYLKHYQ